jgi:disulfide bond formation protein DsbB
MFRSNKVEGSSILQQTTDRYARLFACWALVLAGIGLAGSLYLSIGLGLRACPLCFYQRTFVMAVFAVLAIGLIVDRARGGFLCLLSLPMAVGGLGVAALHEYLVWTDKLECPPGLFAVGTAPAQSLTLFALLAGTTLAGAWAGRWGPTPFGLPAILAASLLGVLLSWAAVASSPPITARTTAYPENEPFNTCRPPYRPG